MKNNENLGTCAACGGVCCKTMPGSYLPKQLTDEQVHHLLVTGQAAIDWWEGDPRPDKNKLVRANYLRAATKKAAGKIFDPSWGGECVHLTNSGCALTFEARPWACQTLIPNPDKPGECKLGKHKHKYTDKQIAACAWIPRNETLEQIGRSLT